MIIKSPAIPTPDVIQRALKAFHLSLNNKQIQQIQQYMDMLLRWNEKVNLTAIRDPLEILNRHFCESMFAAAVLPIESGRLADVGSGGGFPGLPLKIIRPELQVFLIESNVKKATFLAEVVRELELGNTRVLVSRYEELAEEVAPLDFVCSRALGEFASFLGWARSPSVAAKEAILWLGATDADQVCQLSGWEWQQPIPVPHSLQKVLLVGYRQATAEV